MAAHFRLEPIAFTLAALAASGLARGDETVLPQVSVQEQAERADGPVTGYRATRSSTFTKTDTPLIETPASIQIVTQQMLQDQNNLT